MLEVLSAIPKAFFILTLTLRIAGFSQQKLMLILHCHNAHRYIASQFSSRFLV